ncbi:MAG: hypothetical protein WA842_10510 [Croceibacterium sp.]
MTFRLSTSLILAALLAGCASSPASQQTQPVRTPPPRPAPGPVPPTKPTPPPPTSFRAPQVLRVPGLEGVLEADGDNLIRQFGQPRLDVTEGDMRKLQFAGEACVLDLYLYPLREGGKPVATYLDTRRSSDGLDVDRRACVEALRRR